jgi:hypothetical protein
MDQLRKADEQTPTIRLAQLITPTLSWFPMRHFSPATRFTTKYYASYWGLPQELVSSRAGILPG